jgi:predicted nuclease with RNAse H fold
LLRRRSFLYRERFQDRPISDDDAATKQTARGRYVAELARNPQAKEAPKTGRAASSSAGFGIHSARRAIQMPSWFGCDPGGENKFGVAALSSDGRFETWCVSSVDEAVAHISQPMSLGIDCPMWWSSGAGGGRKVDSWLRKTYKIHPGTVRSVNSLPGAVLVQGIMLAIRVREKHPGLPITETHPKALLLARGLGKNPQWLQLTKTFGLDGPAPENEHRRDALLSAVAAREGEQGHWRDISRLERGRDELDPKQLCFGHVDYWWPNEDAVERR